MARLPLLAAGPLAAILLTQLFAARANDIDMLCQTHGSRSECSDQGECVCKGGVDFCMCKCDDGACRWGPTCSKTVPHCAVTAGPAIHTGGNIPPIVAIAIASGVLLCLCGFLVMCCCGGGGGQQNAAEGGDRPPRPVYAQPGVEMGAVASPATPLVQAAAIAQPAIAQPASPAMGMPVAASPVMAVGGVPTASPVMAVGGMPAAAAAFQPAAVPAAAMPVMAGAVPAAAVAAPMPGAAVASPMSGVAMAAAVPAAALAGAGVAAAVGAGMAAPEVELVQWPGTNPLWGLQVDALEEMIRRKGIIAELTRRRLKNTGSTPDLAARLKQAIDMEGPNGFGGVLAADAAKELAKKTGAKPPGMAAAVAAPAVAAAVPFGGPAVAQPVQGFAAPAQAVAAPAQAFAAPAQGFARPPAMAQGYAAPAQGIGGMGGMGAMGAGLAAGAALPVAAAMASPMMGGHHHQQFPGQRPPQRYNAGGGGGGIGAGAAMAGGAAAMAAGAVLGAGAMHMMQGDDGGSTHVTNITNINYSEVSESADTVKMYGGGKDDRPGGGPPDGAGPAVPCGPVAPRGLRSFEAAKRSPADTYAEKADSESAESTASADSSAARRARADSPGSDASAESLVERRTHGKIAESAKRADSPGSDASGESLVERRTQGKIAESGKGAGGPAARRTQPGGVGGRTAERGGAWDLKAWFEQQVCGSCDADREAALGRIGPLPYEREVLWREEGDANQEIPAVCLVTQCSADRLDRLQAQLSNWDGEVSAAVFIDEERSSAAAEEARAAMKERFADLAEQRRLQVPSRPACWTITVLYRLPESEVRCPAYDRLYPVNAVRNAALRGARAELVFLLDVDFLPSRGLFERLCPGGAGAGAGGARLLWEALSSRQEGPLALVVPAFEAAQLGDEAWGPEELRAASEAGVAEGFHVAHFPKGHRATDFERWFAGPAPDGSHGTSHVLQMQRHGVDAYQIHYEEHFEPYIVAARRQLPAYDERFRGYGLNKISHLFEVAARGFGFCVIDHDDAFVVAEKHPRSQSWELMYGVGAERERRARVAVHYEAFKRDVRARTESVKAQSLQSLKDEMGRVQAQQQQDQQQREQWEQQQRERQQQQGMVPHGRRRRLGPRDQVKQMTELPTHAGVAADVEEESVDSSEDASTASGDDGAASVASGASSQACESMVAQPLAESGGVWVQ